MELFAQDDDDKLQFDDTVLHWVQYPFYDDVVVKSPLSSSSSPCVNETLRGHYSLCYFVQRRLSNALRTKLIFVCYVIFGDNC